MPSQDLVIQIWPTNKIRPYMRTLRKNDHAVEQMVAAITEFGFRIPVLVRSDGELIDGQLRLKAAQKLGLSEVPVIVCDDWTPAQVKAFRLLVNRSATWATWDLEGVGFELAELKLSGLDLKLTGFSGFEIDSLLSGNDSQSSADAIPDLPRQPVSRPGDLWQCGDQRVLCGDATAEADVLVVLGADTPHLMITDPPYGVDYDPLWREQAGLGAQRQTGAVQNDDRADWTAAYRLFPGDVAYLWHAGRACGGSGRRHERSWLQHSQPDYLGQTALCPEPRSLPLAARTLLVRSAPGPIGTLVRGPQAIHLVAAA